MLSIVISVVVLIAVLFFVYRRFISPRWSLQTVVDRLNRLQRRLLGGDPDQDSRDEDDRESDVDD